MVDVTQADREAASKIWTRGVDLGSPTAITKGNCDKHPLVKILATHRTQSTAALQSKMDMAVEALRRIVAANHDAPNFGMCDQIDNQGYHYQSADLAAALIDAAAIIAAIGDE